MNEIQFTYFWLMPSVIFASVVIKDYPNDEKFRKTNYLSSILIDLIVSIVIILWPIFAIFVIQQIMKQK